MVEEIIGAGMGLINGELNRQWQERQSGTQWEREKEGMGIQYNYNEKSAENADRRTRNLYTDLLSPAAKKRQIEEAGLSYGLLYGSGGGAIGGNVSSGAQGGGVGKPSPSMPTGNPYDITSGINAMAQAKLANASAKKAEAETKNITGESERGKAEIAKIQAETSTLLKEGENKEADTKYKALMAIQQELQNRITEGSIQDQIGLIKANREKAAEEVHSLVLQNGITEKAREAIIDSYYLNNKLTSAQIMVAQSQGTLNLEQANLIGETVLKTVAETDFIKHNDVRAGEIIKLNERQLDLIEKNIEQQLEIAKIHKSALIWASSIGAVGNLGSTLMKIFLPGGIMKGMGGNMMGTADGNMTQPTFWF